MVNSGNPDNETITWLQNGSILTVGGPKMLSLTFVPKISDNLNTYTCTANNGVDQPLTYSVQLNLTLIPRILMMVSPSQTVVEGQALKLICVLEPLHTLATITWIHDNKTVLEASITKETDMKNDNLKTILLKKVKRGDAGYYQCIANNSAGIDETHKEIVVQFAPNVIIKKAERTNETSCICEASGIPSKYTFEPWEHLAESRQHIRYGTGFSKISTSTLLLRKSVESGSYQDSGIYVCRVSNAIPDVNGQLLQNESITLPYIGKPVFISTPGVIQHGQLGENVSLEAHVFSYPNQSSLHSYWNVTNKLVNCTRCKQSCNQMKLKTSFHKALVEVTVYKCSLAIQNIQESDFQLYTITVSNTFGNCSLTIKLASTNKGESFKAIYIAIIVISVSAVIVMLLTCWQGINVVKKRREDALSYTVNEEVVSGVAENSLYQLGTFPRSSEEYSSIDRRSPIDGRFDSEVHVHTVAQNSENQFGVVAAAHSYELSSSSDEYSSIDRRSHIDGRFDSDEFDSGKQFIQLRAVHNSSENINLLMHEDQDSRRLHYAEISFKAVGTPLQNEHLIRELGSSTEYAEVYHTVKLNPLPDSGSDISSEEDFVNVRNIQQWRRELFK